MEKAIQQAEKIREPDDSSAVGAPSVLPTLVGSHISRLSARPLGLPYLSKPSDFTCRSASGLHSTDVPGRPVPACIFKWCPWKAVNGSNGSHSKLTDFPQNGRSTSTNLCLGAFQSTQKAQGIAHCSKIPTVQKPKECVSHLTSTNVKCLSWGDFKTLQDLELFWSLCLQMWLETLLERSHIRAPEFLLVKLSNLTYSPVTAIYSSAEEWSPGSRKYLFLKKTMWWSTLINLENW